MLDLLRDLWGFASARKKFWLVPLIGTLLILSLMIAIAEFSTVIRTDAGFPGAQQSLLNALALKNGEK